MGPYDNHAADGRGSYLESPDWEDGQWLVDDDGNLFIVPVGGDQVEGPEGPTADLILNVLRKGGRDVLTSEEIEVLELCEVQPSLRRFSPEAGYFHA